MASIPDIGFATASFHPQIRHLDVLSCLLAQPATIGKRTGNTR
jgi:hypothetical protein